MLVKFIAIITKKLNEVIEFLTRLSRLIGMKGFRNFKKPIRKNKIKSD